MSLSSDAYVDEKHHHPIFVSIHPSYSSVPIVKSPDNRITHVVLKSSRYPFTVKIKGVLYVQGLETYINYC